MRWKRGLTVRHLWAQRLLDFGEYMYIEHLAIDGALRSQGYGVYTLFSPVLR
jgi:hypothetical protein